MALTSNEPVSTTTSRRPDVLASSSAVTNGECTLLEVASIRATSAANLKAATDPPETTQRNRSDTEHSEASVTSISSDSDGVVRVFVTEDMQGNNDTSTGITASTSRADGTDSSHENYLRAGQSSVQTSNLNPGRYVPSNDDTASQQHLPDILNAHLPPAYESLSSSNRQRTRRGISMIRMPEGRFVRRNRRRRSTVVDVNSPRCKCNNCLACITTMTYFKWVLVLLTVLGLCCIITGIILGALHMTGSSYLTLSLMFIGLGVMLVIVVIVAWRCTPPGHEPCHLLFGLGVHSLSSHQISSSSRHRRQDTNIPQWHGGLIYPECAHRQPPPSYNASMQQYERQLQARLENAPSDGSLPNSPPPTYRSRPGTMRPGVHITFPQLSGDYPSSRPPTYRSHISNTGTLRRPSVIVQTNEAVCGGHGPVSLQPTVTVDTSLFVQTMSQLNGELSNQIEPNVNSQESNQTTNVSAVVSVHDEPAQSRSTNVSAVVSVNELPTAGPQYFGTAERNAVECFDTMLAESWPEIDTLTLERALLVSDTPTVNNDAGIDNLASDTSTEDDLSHQVSVADVSVEFTEAVML